MAHVHFPASEEAGERIARMGEARDSIFVVGSTSFDVLKELDLKNLEPIMTHQKLAGVGGSVEARPGEYLVVIQHPVTTEYEENLAHVSETTASIEQLKIPTFWIWPNMDAGSDGISKGIRLYRERSRPSHVHFFKSLPIEMFGPLLSNAACIVGNSSSGIREAAFLGTPAVNIGSRQHGRDRGHNVLDVGYSKDEIVDAIKQQVRHGAYESDGLYGSGDAAGKIVPILAEYNFKVQKRIVY
jgi:UDP-hydrolysing UDP-N-acetyl-D-glucosamine 2-epimerase